MKNILLYIAVFIIYTPLGLTQDVGECFTPPRRYF